MASELKPCPFCGGTDLSSGGDDKFVGYSCKTCQATGPNHYGSRDWNTSPTPVAPVSSQGIVISNRFYEHLIALTGYHITRPPTPDHEFVNVCNGDLRKLSDFMDTVAPVSPDATGKCGELVTVRYEIVETLPSGTTRWKCVEHEHHANSVAQMLEHPTTVNALVHRSQAAKLLAAKDAENAYLKELVAARGETIKRGDDRIRKLEAKLAAEIRRERDLAEKQLSEVVDRMSDDYLALKAELDQAVGVIEDRSSEYEALEAKLVEAEKALAFYADPSKWNDGYFKSEDDGTVLRAYPSSIEKDHGDKARAVLKL